jgi:hypothetical protein
MSIEYRSPNLYSLTACSIGKSFIIPSSVVAEDDRGGEGVEERNDDAPELESTEGGRSGFVKLCAVVDGIKFPSPEAALAGEHDSFIRSIAALHSVIVSLLSSIMCSLVRRFLELQGIFINVLL